VIAGGAKTAQIAQIFPAPKIFQVLDQLLRRDRPPDRQAVGGKEGESTRVDPLVEGPRNAGEGFGPDIGRTEDDQVIIIEWGGEVVEPVIVALQPLGDGTGDLFGITCL